MPKRANDNLKRDNRHLGYGLTREENINKKQKTELDIEHQQRLAAEAQQNIEHQQRIFAEQQRLNAEAQRNAEYQQRLLAEQQRDTVQAALTEEHGRVIHLERTVDELYQYQHEFESLENERRTREQLRLNLERQQLANDLSPHRVPFAVMSGSGGYGFPVSSPPGLSSDDHSSDSSSSTNASPFRSFNHASSSNVPEMHDEGANTDIHHMANAEANTVERSLMDKWHELKTSYKFGVGTVSVAGLAVFFNHIKQEIDDYWLWAAHKAIATNQNTKKDELIRLAIETKYPDVLETIFDHKNANEECRSQVVINPYHSHKVTSRAIKPKNSRT